MDKQDEILLSLGRIEGQLIEIATLPKRVSALESYQAKIKGAVAVLGTMWLALVAVLVKWVGFSYGK